MKNRFDVAKTHATPKLFLKFLTRLKEVHQKGFATPEEQVELGEVAESFARRLVRDARDAELWRESEKSLEKALAEVSWDERRLN